MESEYCFVSSAVVQQQQQQQQGLACFHVSRQSLNISKQQQKKKKGMKMVTVIKNHE